MVANIGMLVSGSNPNGVTTRNLTQEDIMRTLQDIRNQRSQPTYFRPRNYEDFMPRGLGYQEPDYTLPYQNLRATQTLGDKATEYFLTLQQNKQAKQNLLKSKKEQKYQQQQIKAQQQADAAAANYTPPKGSVGGTGSTTPGPIKGFNPNAKLGTYQWHGFSLTLNSSVANRFIGFLNALSAKGYKFKTVYSYANRPIEGTNIPSLHSKGLAMDINPTDNPVTYNGHNITNLPPGVGSLAAKYGLKWGGSWIHSKRDPMHFSVPYGGIE